MKTCVFCQIAQSPESEEYRIISNNKFIAMLVSHPETRGHFIVFPKSHASEIKQVPNKLELFKTTIKQAEKVVKKLKAPAYTLKVNNNVYALGDDPLHIGHVHVHIIPRYTQKDTKSRKPTEAQKETLVEIKKQILGDNHSTI